MVSSPTGKASRSSSCPICAREPVAQASMNTAQAARHPSRMRSVVRSAERITVIVAEFHAARKIETCDDHAFFTRQAGCRAQAEAARHHPVNRPPGPQHFDPLLSQCVHGAFVI